MTRYRTVHGESRNQRTGQPATPEYCAWTQMRDRCRRQSHPGYELYGGRGITVCARWSSFQNFLADMGRRPSSSHSIDRIDNDGNYEPGNCRWATPKEQASNRSPNRFVEIEGERVTVQEASRRLGLGKNTVAERLRHGWSVERALTPGRVIAVTNRGLVDATLAAFKSRAGVEVSTADIAAATGFDHAAVQKTAYKLASRGVIRKAGRALWICDAEVRR